MNLVARDYGELLSQVRVNGEPLAFCLVVHVGHQARVALETTSAGDQAANWLRRVADGLELGTLAQSGKPVN